MGLNLPDFSKLIKPRENDLQVMMGKELQNSFDRVRNKYAEPKAQGELQQQELANRLSAIQNQYAEPQAEASLGLHRAQTQEHQAKAAQAQQDMALFRAMFSGELGGGQNMNPFNDGQNMRPQMGQQGMQPSMDGMGQPQGDGAQSSSMPNGFPDNIKQAFREGHIRNKGHIPQAQNMVLPSGQIATYDPLKGGWSVQQLGDTAAETETKKGLAQHNVKAVEENYKDYSKAIAQKHGLEGMLKSLEDPNLQKSVGPFWKNSAAKYFGTDKAKEAQAEFNTYGKTIISETAKAFGGSMTNQEMNWIKDVLPSDGDTLPAIKGKAKTLAMLREAIEQKTVMKDQLLRNVPGMNPIEADQLAESAIDLKAIKKAINPHITFKGPNGEIEDVPKSDATYIEMLKKANYREDNS